MLKHVGQIDFLKRAILKGKDHCNLISICGVDLMLRTDDRQQDLSNSIENTKPQTPVFIGF